MKGFVEKLKGLGIYRLILLTIALGTLAYVISYEEQKDQAWTSWSMPLSGTIIAIDAGHGGMDGGAVAKNGLLEKEITLPIAFYLRDYLQEAGALVIMTREEDRDLAESDERPRKAQDLKRRVDMVNDSSADMLISIHLNSIPSPKWRGAQTFYNPNRKENYILAQLIQEELIVNLQNTDRKEKMNQDIFLLKSVDAIAALVEVGFLSNPEEADLLVSPNYQRQIAASIYRGILRYFAGERDLSQID